MIQTYMSPTSPCLALRANPEAAGVIEAVAVNPTQRSPTRPFILRFFPNYKLRHLELSPLFKWMDQSSVPTGYPALSGLQQAQTTAVTAIRLRLSPHFEEVCEKFLPRLSRPGSDSPCCRAADRTRRLQGSGQVRLWRFFTRIFPSNSLH
ncbi:hypothetical protein XENOCAPTIV_016048 [Xenoophorus captivus]|uniref:Uncharacterized protein n=1 Tax=Xenoophorus captivus TaxID=1517983 RepID=A0ABV0S437_9TELE